MSLLTVLTVWVLAFYGLASICTANSITFVNLGPQNLVVWTTQGVRGAVAHPVLYVQNGATQVLDLPGSWSGSFKTIPFSQNLDAGTVIGEVTFQGNAGDTFFDVSAVDNHSDDSGVHFLMPLKSRNPTSGCQFFPCSGSFTNSGDRQSKSTPETNLICFIGGNGV